MPSRRRKPTLESHLWIVNTVLTEVSNSRSDPGMQSNLSSALYRYILAMSCQKIHVRLQNELSTGFMSSIDSVEECNIKLPSQAPWIEKSIKDTEDHAKEGNHDYCLMTEFLALTNDPELELLNTSVTNLTSIDIPEPKTSADFSKIVIYTDETYLEFHRLLKELLSRFRSAIEELAALDEQPPAKFDPRKFATHMLDAQLMGYALLKLS